jgi:hypothetical protein
MTPDRLAQGLREPELGGSERERAGLPAATVLAMCDRLLGEPGRRRHMFAWLRVHGAGRGEWLAVDAYYPRARLVVLCHPPGPNDELYRELVPAHGLGLLTLDPAVLGDDPEAVEAALAGKIFDLEHVPRRDPSPARAPWRRERTGAPAPAPSPGPQAEASQPAATEWTPVKVGRAPVAPAVEQGLGVVVGLVLAGLLIAEVYLGVVAVAFGDGRVVLGFAIAIDACARALGTVAAARAGRRAWAGGCALGGAPVVASFALLPRAGRVDVEPAPLAGLLAVLAMLLAVLGLLIGS